MVWLGIMLHTQTRYKLHVAIIYCIAPSPVGLLSVSLSHALRWSICRYRYGWCWR